MKAFVTGGTGYLGSNLIKKLLQSGYEVHALCRGTVERELMQHPQLKWFEGDVLNPQSVINAMQHCTVAFHTAGYVRVWSKNPEAFFKQNVEGTATILNCALDRNIKKTVITSSAGVLGSSKKFPAHEDSIRTRDFINHYESSKFMAEDIAKTFALRGLPVCIVNPARIYGPGLLGRSNGISQMIMMHIKNAFGLIPGDGKSIGCYSNIDDVVNGHLFAMEKGRAGERYILGGENISFNDFYKIIDSITNQSKPTFHIPVMMLRFFAASELWRAKLFNHEPWIVPSWVDRTMQNLWFDSSKAIHELGYQITPLQTGIEETIFWLVEKNLIKLNSIQHSLQLSTI